MKLKRKASIALVGEANSLWDVIDIRLTDIGYKIHRLNNLKNAFNRFKGISLDGYIGDMVLPCRTDIVYQESENPYIEKSGLDQCAVLDAQRDCIYTADILGKIFGKGGPHEGKPVAIATSNISIDPIIEGKRIFMPLRYKGVNFIYFGSTLDFVECTRMVHEVRYNF